MFKKTQKILDEYHQRMAEEAALMQRLPKEEGMRRRDEFLLPVGEEVGQFLNQMVKAANAKTILEIGTSYGYSTVWLAAAAQQTGGKVITLEIDAKKAAYAKKQIEKAGLAEYVEFQVNDALKSISDLRFRMSDTPHGQPKSETPNPKSIDFVLVDIWKELYVPAFELFYPMLAPGAYVIGDNMLHPPIHREDANAYRAAVKATGAFDSVLLPIGSGIEVSRLISDL